MHKCLPIRKLQIVLTLLTVLAVPAFSNLTNASDAKDVPHAKKTLVKVEKPRIQIAILLDTSGSMNGLINQARAHLWSIVNEFATTRQNGQIPQVEVALFHYGNDGLPASEGHIGKLVELSTDLDTISEKLFALTTNGGSEYCGHVIQTATKSLNWSKSNKDYKAIFIAGNEPFSQGSVRYQKACKAAINKGIIVNTIHCGDHATGVSSGWADGAALADGDYVNINHNKAVAHINAPQDKEIAELNAKLNTTYVRYGNGGLMAMKKQMAQDSNALRLSAEVAASRAKAKTSSNYVNSHWDLVDAVKEGKVDLKDLNKDELPEELKNKTAEELTVHIKEMQAKRGELQAKLKALIKARDAYVAQERKKAAAKGGKDLGTAVLKSVRMQLEKKNFKKVEK